MVTSQVIAQVKQVTSQVIQKSDDLTQFPHLKIGKESGSFYFNINNNNVLITITQTIQNITKPLCA